MTNTQINICETRRQAGNCQLSEEVERLKGATKQLVAKIRDAHARFETWVVNPAWACEEFNDFTVACNAVMKEVERSGE